MLGFGALGQQALGQLPSQMARVQPGHGDGSRRFTFVPAPAYDVKPSKPFRPVWDRPGKVEEPATPEPVMAVPLPPASIFQPPPGAPPPMTSTPPFGLPDFASFGVADPAGFGRGMRNMTDDITDSNDALAAIFAALEGPESVN